MTMSPTRRLTPLDRGYYWSDEDLARLRALAADRLETRAIAIRLGRTPKAIRTKASELGISLAGYSRTLRARYPDPTGERTLHKKRRVIVTTSFDFERLTYDERLALAQVLLSSVPASYQHEGRDMGGEGDPMPQPSDERDDALGIAAPAAPDLDDPALSHLDAAQIRERLGIPLLEPPPKPAPYIPWRFRPRAKKDASDKPEESDEPTMSQESSGTSRRREGTSHRAERRAAQLQQLEANAAQGRTWAAEELEKRSGD